MNETEIKAAFPIILKGMEGHSKVRIAKLLNLNGVYMRQTERFVAAAGVLLAGGDISAARLKDAKDDLNHTFELAYDALVFRKQCTQGHPWRFSDNASQRELYLFTSDFTHPMLHNIVGRVKKLQSTKLKHEIIEFILTFYREILPLGEAVKNMNVVKREPKPVEDRVAKYNAPSVSGTATAKVRDLLIQITEDTKLALQARIAEDSQEVFDEYMAAQAEAIGNGGKLGVYEYFCPRNARFPRHAAAQLVHKLVDNGYNGKPAIAKPDYKTIIVAMAETEASEIRENFVYKNLDKIVSIVEAKGNYETGEILGHYINLRGLKGTLRFRFEDGSHFTVQNSVVYVCNSYNTAFNRWPLTFHDVVLPGGKTKMKRPSEQRMNEVFVKGGE